MVDIIVGGSDLLQYHLELGRSGMEDGLLSLFLSDWKDCGPTTMPGSTFVGLAA